MAEVKEEIVMCTMKDGSRAYIAICEDKVLGEGTFGKVYLCYDTICEHEYAAKIFSRPKNGSNQF